MKLLDRTCMIYVGRSNKSQTQGNAYRIRATINVGNKTYYEFYDNRSRIKISDQFMGIEKYSRLKSEHDLLILMNGDVKRKFKLIYA